MSSEIKADKWSPASGTSATIGDSGDTYTVPSGVTLDIASGATLDATGATVSGITSTTINNNADNRVITGSGTANTLEGESTLTYNGTILQNNQAQNTDATFHASSYTTGVKLIADSQNSISKIDASGNLAFINASSERMRIDSSGNILMGKTSTSFNADGGMITEGGQQIKLTRDGDEVCFASNFINTSGYPMAFHYSGSTVGTIRSTNNSTSYNTSSDYRLKENEVAISDGIKRLKNLKPYRFNFKNDKDKTVDGFFAHEVSSVVPEAISGTKDATETYTDDKGDEQTRIKPQSIDQSKLVPLLTSALQEAITKIETLEAKVAALESA